MKILFAILALTLCTTALSEDPPNTTTGTTVTDQSTISPDTTTTELSTSTSTEKPTTTTSTEKPTTTTSTTPSSTTEEPVTPSTTTTTTSTTTTTTPAPALEKCTWNTTCIKAEMKARFVIDMKGEKSSIDVGCNATLNVDCSSNVTQTLTLSEADYTLTMVFEKESEKFFVKNITLNYDFPDGEKGFVSNSDKLFNVKVGNSYLCRSESDIHLGNVTMQVSELHIQAFGDKDTFGTAEECDADDKVSGVIPIAVGIALAALIIIVLIAYLVGRRRSRQRGYQSV